MYVSCSVSVGNCRTPDRPIGGKIPDCDDVNNLIYKRCSVECDIGKAFLRPVPKFYSCGPIGVWNTNSPMNRFKFPPCGGKFKKKDLTRFAIQAKGPDGKWKRKPLAYRESNNVHLLITRPPEICVNLVFKHIHAASSYIICIQFVPFIYCPL